MKFVFKHQNLYIFALKLNKCAEFVGRGSETQLEVGENLNKLT